MLPFCTLATLLFALHLWWCASWGIETTKHRCPCLLDNSRRHGVAAAPQAAGNHNMHLYGRQAPSTVWAEGSVVVSLFSSEPPQAGVGWDDILYLRADLFSEAVGEYEKKKRKVRHQEGWRGVYHSLIFTSEVKKNALCARGSMVKHGHGVRA